MPPSHSALAVLGMLLTALRPEAGAAEQAPASLEDLLGAARQKDGYRSPSAAEVARAEDLFERLLLEGALRSPDEWQALGFESTELDVAGGPVLVLRPAPGRAEGQGVYAFRPGSASALALEAPHSFHDRHTGTIAARLMVEGPFAAAAWNTVPRSYEEAGTVVDADLAHLEMTYFNAFTRAWGAARPRGMVVQLHGFGQTKRRSAAGRDADMILSAASAEPHPAVLRAAACLKREMPGVVRLYPTEVRELGATSNTNARMLREVRGAAFMHVEISLRLRLRLRDRAAVRQRFNQCLVEALE